MFIKDLLLKLRLLQKSLHAVPVLLHLLIDIALPCVNFSQLGAIVNGLGNDPLDYGVVQAAVLRQREGLVDLSRVI